MTGWEILDTTQAAIGLPHIEMPIIRQNCRNNSGQYNITELPGLSNANHLLITLGKNMSHNYALEGVYANGMSDATTTSVGTTVNVRLASS